VDRRQRGQNGDRAWWCARLSLASGHSVARELTGEGTKERGEHGEPILGLTRARAVVWRPDDGSEEAVVVVLSGGSTGAWRGERCGGG
jgi:hypothetical protein